MAPIPAVEPGVPETEPMPDVVPRGRRSAPRIAAPESAAPVEVLPDSAQQTSVDRYVAVDTKPRARDLRTFDAVVVYLGANPRRSDSIRGHVYRQEFLRPGGGLDVREIPVSGEGMQCYEFWSVGLDGRPLHPRLVSAQAVDPSIRNKPWQPCVHPDHLLFFLRQHEGDENSPPSFKVLIAPEQQLAWQDFVLKAQKSDPLTQADIELVTHVLKDQ